MKVSVNDVELFNMSDIKKQVICNDIPDEVLEEDLQRRMAYILAHKYERCMERLKKEWLPKLKAAGVANIPLDDDAFAALVFARPEYKNRSQRELAANDRFAQEVVQANDQIKRQKEMHVKALQ